MGNYKAHSLQKLVTFLHPSIIHNEGFVFITNIHYYGDDVEEVNSIMNPKGCTCSVTVLMMFLMCLHSLYKPFPLVDISFYPYGTLCT